MKLNYVLAPFIFCACTIPTNEQPVVDTTIDSETEIDTESDDSVVNDDETAEESIPENEQKESEPSLVLESNTWYPAEAVLIEDNCGWDPLLREFFGMGADALLPSDFTVEGLEGSFLIQANNYGANEPITCDFNEFDFECETQSVVPLDFDLGTYGWTYAIDFSGTAIDENSIYGVAEVSFPTISDWLIPIFQSVGIDASQCIQSFELSITTN